MTRIDVKEPAKSVAIVYWKDPQISPADAKKYVALAAGTWFPKPYERTYRVKRIEERRAIFEKVEKDDQENFTEVVLNLTELRSVTATSRPARSPGAMTGHGTESRPMSTAPIPETREINPHEYILSEKDRDLAKDKGLEMIGRDVHTAPYLDPKTQRPEGLIVKSIRQNSLPSKLGLKENDVVRG